MQLTPLEVHYLDKMKNLMLTEYKEDKIDLFLTES